MFGFRALFMHSMKRRIKDSFMISYGIITPVLLIAFLGYISSGYYSSDEGMTSYYYYTIVTIPLCIFFNAITFIYLAREESEFKCGERLILAPIGRWAMLLSKVIPSTLSLGLFNLIVLYSCKLIFGVNFNGYFFEIYLLMFVLGFMSCTVGTYIGLTTRNFVAVKSIANIPIMLMALLGGAFFPIGALGKGMELVSYLSPLTWVNRGIFQLLLDHRSELYILALGLTLITGLLFLAGSIYRFKREALIS